MDILSKYNKKGIYNCKIHHSRFVKKNIKRNPLDIFDMFYHASLRLVDRSLWLTVTVG